MRITLHDLTQVVKLGSLMSNTLEILGKVMRGTVALNLLSIIIVVVLVIIGGL